MKDRKLAARYARALLSVFPDPTQAEATDRFLDTLREAMEQAGDFRDLMLDPAVSLGARKKLLRTLVERAELPQQVSRFLETVVDNNRATALPAIARVFHEEREEALGIVPAEITTATPITDQQQRRASAAIEKLTGRKVRLSYLVEPGLLGGAVTRVGTTIYDGSLRTQLSQLRHRMTQE